MKTVCVSGGFDPIHIGHVRMFNAAKKLGNKLIVILNNDNFLKNKKGYIFMPVAERREIIENLKAVDEVIVSRSLDKTVIRDLKNIVPDIFANGGDWDKNNPPPEIEICEKLGIEIVFGVGGGKVQSSSKLVGEIK